MSKIELLDYLSEYLNDYLPFGKGLSANTVTSYRVAFQLLFEFLYVKKRIRPERAAFDTLSGDIVTEFLYWLESDRGCSAKTRNHRRTALVSFASFVMRKNIAVGSAFYTAMKNTPRRKIHKNTDILYFTRDEVGILLGLPDASSKLGYRNKVLLAVHMLESGIPLAVIKTFLGHESITSTMVYAEVTPELANKYLLEHSKLTETAISPLTVAVYSEKLPFIKKYLYQN